MVAAAVLATVVATGLLENREPVPAARPVAADPATGAPTPAPGTATVAPAPTLSAVPPAARPVAGAPLRIEAPTVGLAATVLPITPSGEELDPPTFGEAYWIRDYGRPGSDNTTYIAGHSATRGTAVFDALFDQERQRTRVSPGDPVVVTTAEGRFTYEVTSAVRYRKGELATTDEVWSIVPGRLVLITCFQRADGGASRDNLVVYAELVDGPVQAG